MSKQTLVDLERVAGDSDLLEVGRRAVEKALIEMRESRISMFGRGNGLVIKEKCGADSSMIRLGAEDAIRIGLRAISKHLQRSGAKCRLFGGVVYSSKAVAKHPRPEGAKR